MSEQPSVQTQGAGPWLNPDPGDIDSGQQLLLEESTSAAPNLWESSFAHMPNTGPCSNVKNADRVGIMDPVCVRNVLDPVPPSPSEPINISLPLPDDANVTRLPKIGQRFSSASLRVLKTWMSNNAEHPYPTPADIELLQRQTGLQKQQVVNWMSNSRRRWKQKTVLRPSTTRDRTLDVAEVLRRRRPSPAPFEHLNPLERWQYSPPDHEPASVLAIAQAVSGLEESTAPRRASSGPARSLYSPSSASGAGTSHSSGSSFASAWSNESRTSLGSIQNLRRAIKKRRRRVLDGNNTGKMLSVAVNTFQCTFCTETFKTKHNWQRHEKSLHLSLEEWICAPNGPVFVTETFQPVCVYCGLVDPDQEHVISHNHLPCAERAIEDRTFYRKDHLQQHLRLVHNARFSKWLMDTWKRESKDIRSRCGFCGAMLADWNDRADHLAEHFRDGKMMDDWQGDWGFEPAVLDMVENAIAPYLIPYERDSPWPFTTHQGPPETPSSAFNLIRLELDQFVLHHPSNTNGTEWTPSDAELQYEACCVIFSAELVNDDPLEPVCFSWLRDLIMSSEEIAAQARVRPMKSAARSRFTALKIRGKQGIFEGCDMEMQLHQYVDVPKILGVDVSDAELQHEAAAIVQRMEALSPSTYGVFGGMLTRLVHASTKWLAPFRQRADLPACESSSTPSNRLGPALSACLEDFDARNTQTSEFTPSHNTKKNPLTSVIHASCYKRLAKGLSRFVASTTSPRNPSAHMPTDEELQYQARWIWYEDDDPWNQTPADNPDWLQEFKRSVGIGEMAAENGLAPSGT